MHKLRRIDKLEEAQILINRAKHKIREAVKDTSSERYAESYIIAHLDNWANGQSTMDDTIPKMIETILEEE